jgi:hypothetical protein
MLLFAIIGYYKLKQQLNQNNQLWAICITTRGGWDPLNFLISCWCNSCIMGIPLHKNPTINNVVFKTLAINTSLAMPRTLKQTTQYNKYCIWILKPKIKKKNVWHCWKFTDHEYSWCCVRRPNSLCHTILFDADFKLHSIQAPLSAFAYLVWVFWITSARSSSCSSLAYMLRGMAPTPHVVMPKS